MSHAKAQIEENKLGGARRKRKGSTLRNAEYGAITCISSTGQDAIMYLLELPAEDLREVAVQGF